MWRFSNIPCRAVLWRRGSRKTYTLPRLPQEELKMKAGIRELTYRTMEIILPTHRRRRGGGGLHRLNLPSTGLKRSNRTGNPDPDRMAAYSLPQLWTVHCSHMHLLIKHKLRAGGAPVQNRLIFFLCELKLSVGPWCVRVHLK